MSLIGELKRRNVFRVGIAYALAAWVLLQGVDFALDLIGAPDWVIRVLAVLAVIGLPVALVLAWMFELTPEGLKREQDIDRAGTAAYRTGRKLDRLIIACLLVVVGILLTERWMRTGEAPPRASDGSVASLEPSAPDVASEDSSPPPIKQSIAVLPFVNLSSEPEQEYFSDGMTEEILTRLAGIRDLQVAARTSVFSFKGQNRDVREIARMLGVDTILEGSVRKAGDQVRISAQLIRASDGFHLWSQAYDRKLDDIFGIQYDIATQIAQSLQVSLGVSRLGVVSAGQPVTGKAYDLYLRARALHRKRGDDLLPAIGLLEEALAIDPDFAPAWAGLSHVYNVLPNYISAEERGLQGDIGAKSMAAAQRALELDPNLPSALHAMANNLFFRFEWFRAEDFYRRALQLDPDSADIMEDYASLLYSSWQMDKAYHLAERMVELDPYVPIFLYAIVTLHHMNGDWEARDQVIERSLELDPDLINMQFWDLFRLLQYGRYDEARQLAATLNPRSVDPSVALELIDWISDPTSDPEPAALAGLGYCENCALLVDRYDLYIEARLASAREWPEWELGAMIDLLAPVAAPELMSRYRSEPRSKALLTRLRLPEYWRVVGWPDICRPLEEDDFECS
jgi:TolB-like protein/Tfp pilus assembly protein PilF